MIMMEKLKYGMTENIIINRNQTRINPRIRAKTSIIKININKLVKISIDNNNDTIIPVTIRVKIQILNRMDTQTKL